MIDLKPTRGLKQNLPATGTTDTDGRLLYTTDTGEIYVEVADKPPRKVRPLLRLSKETGNAYLSDTDDIVNVDSTLALSSIVINLPATYQGKEIRVKKVAGSEDVVINPPEGYTIDGYNSATIQNVNTAVHLICNGVDQWVILSKYTETITNSELII